MMANSSSFLSPRDLARAVGVSESSVKRWADDDRLEVVRTAGGHRRILLSEALRFVRDAGMDVVRPDILGFDGTETETRANGLPSGGAFFEALERGDGLAARRMLVSAFFQGMTVAALCDGPIRGALGTLGDKWEELPNGIALEHHAVDTCIQALMEIRGSLAPAKKAPLAVGGAIERDPYILPSLMVAVVLAEAGFNTLNLGPNSPADALRTTVEQQAPAIIWRSYSIPVNQATLRTDINLITPRTTRRKQPDLVVGGRGIPRAALRPDSNAHQFSSMSELSGFAKTMLKAGRKRT